MANPNSPNNELNIMSVSGDIHYFYGLNISLTQDNIPYIPPVPGARILPSAASLVVYGDTVTVDSHLMNPGKDIKIIARKIILKKNATINTSGPDPNQDTDFEPGQPAQQKDQSLGATGTAGAEGGPGIKAGDVLLMAESIEGDTDSINGNVIFEDLPITRPLTGMVNSSIDAFKNTQGIDPFSIPDFQIPIPTDALRIQGSLNFKNNQITGLSNIDLDYVTWNQLTFESIIKIKIKNINYACTFEMISTLPLPFKLDGSIKAENFEYDLLIQSTIDPVNKTVPQQQMSINEINLTLHYGIDGELSFIDPSKFLEDNLTPLIVEKIKQYSKQKLDQIISNLSIQSLFKTAFNALVLTKGGRGGRGQDGHKGETGAQGAPGQNMGVVGQELPNTPMTPVPPEAIGGKGNQGGQGGDAGKSGAGADGGNITVGYIKPHSITIAYNNSGGDGGPPASPGAGGDGGQGGPTGNYKVDVMVYINSFQEETREGGSGPQGDAGPPASFQGAWGQYGTHGILSVNGSDASQGTAEKKFTYDQLAPFMRTEQLFIMKRAALFSYLNAQTEDDYKYPLELANWLLNITNPIIQDGFTADAWDSNDIANAKGINDFAENMLSHYQRGLDFFGHYKNWVPILTLDSYQTRLSQLLALGKIIEDQFNIYIDEKKGADQKIAAIDETRQKLRNDIQNDQNEIEELNNQIEQTDQAIQNLKTLLQKQNNIISEDKRLFTDEFREYVEKQNECTFMETLTAISGIIQIGTGVVNGIGVISGAFTVAETATTAIKQFQNAIAIIEKVNSTISSIQLGLDKVNKTRVKSQNKGDVGFVAVNRKDFDDFIKGYLGKINAAEELKKAVDHLFDMIDTLNQTICSYNSLYVTKNKVQADLDCKNSELEKVAAMRQEKLPDPALPGYTLFMQNAYDNLKAVIVKKLYEENRAFEYWSLKSSNFSTSDLNMATLVTTHENLLKKIDPVKSRSDSIYEPFTQEIDIKADQYIMGFELLPLTKKLVFNIPVNIKSFSNQYQVMAEKVKIELPDITTKDNVLTLQIIHPGTGLQVPNNGGEPVHFVHLPRAVPYKIDYQNPHNTAGGLIGDRDQGYTGLSPFTFWTINFDLQGNEWLDLTIIKRVKLTFSGTFVGPPMGDQ